MNRDCPVNMAESEYKAWFGPRWWQLAVIAAGVVILCSCRGVRDKTGGPLIHDVPAGAVSDTLPPTAWTGAPDGQQLGPNQQWVPPGVSRPWPRDEYLEDGGDRRVQTRVGRDWRLQGLDTEDTIAHFDTLDGRTLVEPSNRVCIYAPRFSAVRKVLGVDGYEIRENLVRYDVPLEVQVRNEVLDPGTTAQHLQAQSQINTKTLRNQQRNIPGVAAVNSAGIIEALNREKLLTHRRDQEDVTFHHAAEPMLAKRIEDAIIWTEDEGVQVTINNRSAGVVNIKSSAQAVYGIGHEGTPRLKIIKMASTDVAVPGTIIEFTLEFHNVGTEVIGNVTIVDNLTTRLEYVSGSQECSLASNFDTEPNVGDSLVLRWEVTDPLAIGKGGIIKFKCLVR